MVELTDNAAAAIRRVVDGNADKALAGLRLVVASGGCAGHKYQLAMERAAQAGDIVVERGGAKLFVDSDSLKIVDGTVVDFVEKIEGAGFTFENPNAAHKCSCGKSFSSC